MNKMWKETDDDDKKVERCAWFKRNPNFTHRLLRYVVQPFVFLLIVAVVVLPTTYVFMKHKRIVWEARSRISCLEGKPNEAALA